MSNLIYLSDLFFEDYMSKEDFDSVNNRLCKDEEYNLKSSHVFQASSWLTVLEFGDRPEVIISKNKNDLGYFRIEERSELATAYAYLGIEEIPCIYRDNNIPKNL